MGMPAPHFCFERARHRLRVEFAALLPDHDLKGEVEQQVAQLVAQPGGIASREGLIELEGFFYQVGAQRRARLRAVPGAARAQVAHQREGAGESGVTGHRVLRSGRGGGESSGRVIIRAPVNGSVQGRESRAWVEVSLAAIVENARAVARVAGTRLLPVVKANAYGVGAVAVSKALEAVDPLGYCVATIDEGIELRAAGIARPVLVFLPARPDRFDAYQAHRLTPALGDGATIQAWIARLAGRAGGGGSPFPLEIDTGVSRSGVRWDEIEPIVDLLDTPYLEGCYTHFHSADRRDGSAEAQLERFTAAVGRLPRRPRLLHVANSAAAVRGRAFALDAIRPGIALYGASAGAASPIGKPVITLRARVVSVRTLRRGESVSYNASWTAPRDTTVATLAIGYADGVRRSLGLRGEATVLLNGGRCPVVGLVTMDLTMVEVQHGRAAVGDIATLVGEADGLNNTLDQFAGWSGMITHELLAGLGPRLPRIYD